MNISLSRYLGSVPENYLFSEVAKRVAAAKNRQPHKKTISLGIGDVTLPLPSCAVRAAVVAAEEMGREASFRGYGPESGYMFLKTAVSEHYGRQGVSISPDEIYITDGAKSTLGSIGDIIGNEKLLVPAPTYPVMPDSWLMSGREAVFLPGNRENGFLPSPPEDGGRYVIYLCSPGNPTGAAYTAEGLEKWVNFALSTGSLIVFDAAYSAFSGDGIPRSVFSVKNASECAVEVGSLSKNAGFTGMRCGWLTIPESLSDIASAWKRRQATKFNGVPYIVQRAAEAALTPEGERECRSLVSYYLGNAAILAKPLKKHGIFFTGGENSPYLFARCPENAGSWDFFEHLLDTAGIVCTPGSGFGDCGEGWFRLSAFGKRKTVTEAAERLDRFFDRI
ncbi:MAG: LL-diaminopimelate aminotransferase [Firmicutes bacterium]|uniref:LL-diaminopimelate aminotransferase n=1 Tax=Candidatus Colimorpha enterica TaxID=3083063 RepID=A0AAE3K1D1_9BACT|nr:LL-diaminopimelate aminotransferase [Candidatus Colimorpha enterica]